MTENQTDAKPEISVGQAIGGALGQAQSVLAGLLIDKVAEAGTDRESYLALQRLGVLGDAAVRGRYVADLADWLDLTRPSAAALADRLVAVGLATESGPTVAVTDQGARLRAQIAASISAITAPVYEALSPADVETTVRTLRYLTTGVRAANGSPVDSAAARS